MVVFPGFTGWINQNIQQPPKAESKKSDNVDSNSEPPKDPSIAESNRQVDLWSDAEQKHPWYDPPPKVKVTTQKGLCHMHIELTLGFPPGAVFEMFTNPNNATIYNIDKSGRQLMEHKSKKVLKKDGPRQILKVDKALAWDFLWWSGTFPISLIVDENEKDHIAKYKKEKMMFMKVFEGSYKVEPVYVDSKRLCKHMDPKSEEEYKKCSGGQGKVASKVTMDQYFQPYPLFNFPPLSWQIRRMTINTTKTLLTIIRNHIVVSREVR